MSSIQVCIRMRPLLSEQSSPQKQRILLQGKHVKVELTEQKEKVFRFNHVLSKQILQSQLYQAVHIQKLVERVVEGYHSTIFAYGQTGSGKTYTIQGGQTDKSEGIIPKAIRDLFRIINNQSKHKNQERGFRVYLSFIQIYNESIYDLIDPGQGKPLKMRWNKHQQFTVQNLFECQCRSGEQAIKWWKKGQKNKIMGSHKMNNTSSRSHCMLTLRLQNYSLQDPSDQIQSKLEIVDLAGSERHKSTKSQGVVFREGIEINKSLFILRQVIASLYQSSTSGKTGLVPPYRDSKLTSLLKQSIGGNSYCLMIACLNPTMAYFEESLQTLTYASMASYINNIPTLNIDPKVKQNEQLRQQIVIMNKQIQKLQDHIKILTKMVQSNQCVQCKKRKKKLYSQNDADEAKEPLGILSLPKINDKIAFSNISEEDYSPKEGKRTLKSTKQIFESITMIRDLVTSNSIFREKIEFYKNFIDNQQKQMFNLMKENQSLRQKIQPSQTYISPITQPSSLTQFTKAVNRVQTDIKNQQKHRLKSLTSNNSIKNQEGYHKNQQKKALGKINYNQFLKGRNSLQKKDEKKKRKLYSRDKD